MGETVFRCKPWVSVENDVKPTECSNSIWAIRVNTFEPTLWFWWELGDPKSMAGRDTTYVWDYLSTQRRTSDVLAKARLTRFRWPLEMCWHRSRQPSKPFNRSADSKIW